MVVGQIKLTPLMTIDRLQQKGEKSAKFRVWRELPLFLKIHEFSLKTNVV